MTNEPFEIIGDRSPRQMADRLRSRHEYDAPIGCMVAIWACLPPIWAAISPMISGRPGVTRKLAEALDSPAILSRFSRLVCDPNRGEDDPTIMMRLYDGTIIPGNRNADDAEKEERLQRLYRPYHAAYADLANKMDNPVICAVHSFTPRLQGRHPRPWEIGVLYADDARLALPFMDACRAQGWCTGDNQPYAGHLPGDAVDRHALQHGRPNVLIELRQDLIADEAGQTLWANRLAPVLSDVLAQSGL